jgi:hypothetical protein
MPEEVKIRITTQADTTALKQTQQEIDRLKKAAEEYERKGMGDAAKSARGDAIALQRNLEPQLRASGQTAAADVLKRNTEELQAAERLQTRLGIGHAEALQMARREVDSRSRITAETRAQEGLHKGMTREMREQEASSHRMMRVGNYAGTFGREVLSGGNPMSGMQSMAMASGNPYVMGAAIAAALATAIAGTGAREADRDQAAANRDFERREQSRRLFSRLRSWRGTSGAAESEAFSAEEEAAGLRDQTRDLERKAKPKWWDPSSWTWFGMRRNEGERGLDENAAQQADATNRARENRKIAQQKFESEGGGLQIRFQQERIAGHYKEAIALQELSRWYETRRKLLSEGATEARAQEGANTELFFTRQERMRENASRLVTARSGAADVARAAALANPESDLRRVIDSLGNIHATVDSWRRTPQVARF